MNTTSLEGIARRSVLMVQILGCVCLMLGLGVGAIALTGSLLEQVGLRPHDTMASTTLAAGKIDRIELNSIDGRNKIVIDANTCEMLVTRLVDGIVDANGEEKTSEIRLAIGKAGSGEVSLNCGDQVSRMMSGKNWGGVFAENTKERTLCQLIALSGSSRGNTGLLIYDHKHKSNAANAAFVVDRGNAVLQMSDRGKVDVFHSTKLGAVDSPLQNPEEVLAPAMREPGWGKSFANAALDAARRRAMEGEGLGL